MSVTSASSLSSSRSSSPAPHRAESVKKKRVVTIHKSTLFRKERLGLFQQITALGIEHESPLKSRFKNLLADTGCDLSFIPKAYSTIVSLYAKATQNKQGQKPSVHRQSAVFNVLPFLMPDVGIPATKRIKEESMLLNVLPLYDALERRGDSQAASLKEHCFTLMNVIREPSYRQKFLEPSGSREEIALFDKENQNPILGKPSGDISLLCDTAVIVRDLAKTLLDSVSSDFQIFRESCNKELDAYPEDLAEDLPYRKAFLKINQTFSERIESVKKFTTPLQSAVTELLFCLKNNLGEVQSENIDPERVLKAWETFRVNLEKILDPEEFPNKATQNIRDIFKPAKEFFRKRNTSLKNEASEREALANEIFDKSSKEESDSHAFAASMETIVQIRRDAGEYHDALRYLEDCESRYFFNSQDQFFVTERAFEVHRKVILPLVQKITPIFQKFLEVDCLKEIGAALKVAEDAAREAERKLLKEDEMDKARSPKSQASSPKKKKKSKSKTSQESPVNVNPEPHKEESTARAAIDPSRVHRSLFGRALRVPPDDTGWTKVGTNKSSKHSTLVTASGRKASVRKLKVNTQRIRQRRISSSPSEEEASVSTKAPKRVQRRKYPAPIKPEPDKHSIPSDLTAITQEISHLDLSENTPSDNSEANELADITQSSFYEDLMRRNREYDSSWPHVKFKKFMKSVS